MYRAAGTTYIAAFIQGARFFIFSLLLEKRITPIIYCNIQLSKKNVENIMYSAVHVQVSNGVYTVYHSTVYRVILVHAI